MSRKEKKGITGNVEKEEKRKQGVRRKGEHVSSRHLTIRLTTTFLRERGGTTIPWQI